MIAILARNEFISVLLFFCLTTTTAFGQTSKVKLSGKIVDEKSALPLADVFIQVIGAQTYAVSQADGSFILLLKQPGKYSINFSLLGKKSLKLAYNISADTMIAVRMETLSLALKEVSVTSSRTKVGSSSVIDKTAIKHTQPTSLADALQLLPGQLAVNPDLSAAQQINIRQVPSNSDASRANALGTALVLDGIPFSNNANMQTHVNILNSSPGALAPFSSVAGRGNDLRQIPADQIESIEVIRGVPSARYGDLTTGAILVNTRAGVF
ncbi:MAG: TonB-dependent receptor plug domain-containing protein, partial [Bacteroidia bacterium]